MLTRADLAEVAMLSDIETSSVMGLSFLTSFSSLADLKSKAHCARRPLAWVPGRRRMGLRGVAGLGEPLTLAMDI